MFRLFRVLIYLIAAYVVVKFLINNDGHVTIEWFDYQIAASVNFVLLILFLFVYGLILLNKLIYKALNIHKIFGEKYESKKREYYLNELTEAFIALESEDYEALSKVLKEFESNKSKFPLNDNLYKLLKLKLAMANNNEEEVLKIAEDFVTARKTKNLGMKSKIYVYIKQASFHKALEIAEMLYAINRNIPWVITALIELYTKLDMSVKLEEILEYAVKKNIIKDQEKKERLAYIYYVEAMKLEQSKNYKESSVLLEKAISHLEGNIDFYILLAKTYVMIGDNKSAKLVIDKGWKISPSFELAKLLLTINFDQPKEKKLSCIENLLARATNPERAKLVLAILLFDLKFYEESKEYIENLDTNDLAADKLRLKLKIVSESKYEELKDYLDLI